MCNIGGRLLSLHSFKQGGVQNEIELVRSKSRPAAGRQYFSPIPVRKRMWSALIVIRLVMTPL